MYILLQRQAVSSGLPDINTATSVRSFSMYQNWKEENEDLHVTQVGSTWISVNDMALRCFAEVTLTCSVIVTAWNMFCSSSVESKACPQLQGDTRVPMWGRC